jgi:hypothetical protein
VFAATAANDKNVHDNPLQKTELATESTKSTE